MVRSDNSIAVHHLHDAGNDRLKVGRVTEDTADLGQAEEALVTCDAESLQEDTASCCVGECTDRSCWSGKRVDGKAVERGKLVEVWIMDTVTGCVTHIEDLLSTGTRFWYKGSETLQRGQPASLPEQ